ncbi:head fiber protein [Mesorhizobium caraganae]|uniref:head fiber protein n=1 Tax=Mesorhizobium caraganae TaxID=483206 RepID=UPI001AEE4E50|nr:head fiber protein [Mesorhizobium caraganae]
MPRTLSEDLAGTGLPGATAELIADSIADAASSGGVQSVNGQTGVVVLGAADVGAVDLTTAQTVAGIKTFSASPVVPTPTTTGQASTKGYVDGLDAANVKLTGAQTVAGIKTFSSSPIVPTPTTATQAATMGYVDGRTANATTGARGVVLQAAAQANSAAADIATMVTDFNALLAKLRTAGVLAP